MPINIQDLDQLTQEQVDNAYNVVVQIAQEKNPSIDLKRGAVKDLVLMLSSVMTAMNQVNMTRVMQSNSLLSINQDPTLADSDIVDAAVSNFNTTRNTGTAASGYITIVLNTPKVLVIPKGSQFITNTGLTFKADNTYISRTTQGDVAAATDKLIIQLDSTHYIFTIGAVANAMGSSYNVAQNTLFIPPILDPSVTSSYATSNFTGGTDEETNTQLMARLQSSVASKTMSNRPGITGLLRSVDLPNYDNTFAVSVIGYGDQEQQRYHSILPVAFGGRVDVYVRPQATVQTTEIIKTATYLGPDASNNTTWRLTFARDDAPAMYEVSRITLPTSISNLAVSSFTITSDARTYDLSLGTTAGTTFFPDITIAKEAVYSRYQVATITFTDTITPTTGLTIGTSTAKYGVHYLSVGGIAALQDVVSDVNNRLPIADCLVKAPVPCYLTVALTLNVPSTAPSPVISSIQQTVATTVSSLGFTGQVPASVILNAVHQLVGTAVSVASITMQGRIRRPDGTVLVITNNTLLDAGNDPTNLVTSKTVGLFLNPSDVSVTINNV